MAVVQSRKRLEQQCLEWRMSKRKRDSLGSDVQILQTLLSVQVIEFGRLTQSNRPAARVKGAEIGGSLQEDCGGEYPSPKVDPDQICRNAQGPRLDVIGNVNGRKQAGRSRRQWVWCSHRQDSFLRTMYSNCHPAVELSTRQTR